VLARRQRHPDDVEHSQSRCKLLRATELVARIHECLEQAPQTIDPASHGWSNRMKLTADLTKKRALVTGASSDGFGRYFAKVLAEAGANVMVTARRKKPLEALVQEIELAGGAAKAAVLDVASLPDVQAALEALGPFDIVVNNAGVDIAKPLLDQTEADFDYVMDINLKGVWNVSIEAARQMCAADIAGSVINIASITGLRQVGRITPYAVSKAAVIHLTKQMALELASHNIRVNAIAPGYFESDMTRGYFDSARGQELLNRVPMRRLGDYESLGAVLLMLASDASSFVTGSVIPVDGGHLVSTL
jgi:NAD(P)-dependent dehydrogenase (short-subunit alcohol dehydrogenase family)